MNVLPVSGSPVVSTAAAGQLVAGQLGAGQAAQGTSASSGLPAASHRESDAGDTKSELAHQQNCECLASSPFQAQDSSLPAGEFTALWLANLATGEAGLGDAGNEPLPIAASEETALSSQTPPATTEAPTFPDNRGDGQEPQEPVMRSLPLLPAGDRDSAPLSHAPSAEAFARDVLSQQQRTLLARTTDGGDALPGSQSSISNLDAAKFTPGAAAVTSPGEASGAGSALAPETIADAENIVASERKHAAVQPSLANEPAPEKAILGREAAPPVFNANPPVSSANPQVFSANPQASNANIESGRPPLPHAARSSGAPNLDLPSPVSDSLARLLDRAATPPNRSTGGSFNRSEVVEPGSFAAFAESVVRNARASQAAPVAGPDSSAPAAKASHTNNPAAGLFALDAKPATKQAVAQPEIAFQANIRPNGSEELRHATDSIQQRQEPQTSVLHRQGAVSDSRSKVSSDSNARPEPSRTVSPAQAESSSRRLQLSLDALAQARRPEPVSRAAQPGAESILAKAATPYAAQGMGTSSPQPVAGGGPSAKPLFTPAAAQLDQVAANSPIAHEQPARDVMLRLHSEQHGTANILFQDRAGQVQVTVRAGDPLLVSSLRSELDSLRSGLELRGFQAKVWSPPSSPSVQADTSSESMDFRSQTQSERQARHQRDFGDAERQRRNRQEWEFELE